MISACIFHRSSAQLCTVAPQTPASTPVGAAVSRSRTSPFGHAWERPARNVDHVDGIGGEGCRKSVRDTRPVLAKILTRIVGWF